MKDWALIVALALPAMASAQSDEQAILAAVQGFFDSMESKDAVAARKVTLPEGVFVSVREEDGTKSIGSFSNKEFVDRLPAGTEQVLERMWEPKVMIHQDIAVVWTRYDFHRDGEFSHCGIDAFQLVRTNDGWKIAGGTYTVERTGCPESPLGPPEP